MIDSVHHTHSYEGGAIATPNDFLPPISRWQTFGGFTLLLIFGSGLALAAVLPYKTTVRAPATIRPEGDLRIVEASVAGTVDQITVKANDQIFAGDIVAYLDDAALRSQEQQLQVELSQTQQNLIQIKAQLSALEAEVVAETQTTNRAVAAATNKLNATQRTYHDQQALTRADEREAESAVQLARDELNRYRQLVDLGIVAELQILEREAALETALAQLDRTQALLNPTESEVEQVKEEIAQAQSSGDAILARLNREKEELLRQQTDVQGQTQDVEQRLQQVRLDLEKLTFRAPISGTIQEVTLRNPGQTVEPGDMIAQIAPESAPLKVKALVNQDSVSKIELEQPVRIRIDSCVYTDYGTLPGTISAIAPDAQTATQTSNESEAHFEVEITPQSSVLRNGERDCPLQAGMQGRADIVTQEETILMTWLRKLRLITDW